MSIRSVDDGIIVGIIPTRHYTCQHCLKGTYGVQIDGIKLPKGIEATDRIIGYQSGAFAGREELKMLTFIGIGCGCYAKFHRQIAHISHRISEKARS